MPEDLKSSENLESDLSRPPLPDKQMVDVPALRGRQGSALRALFQRQETSLLMVILIIGILATIKNPTFASSGNLIELGRATVIYFVMACGATLVIIGGGLDFSVGSVFTLGGMVAALLMTSTGLWWPLAVAGGVVVGALAGVVNSIIIARLGVPPIITTLGTFYFISGLVVVVSDGNDIQGLPSGFQTMGQGSLLGVPYIIVYAVVIGILYWFILEKTRFGYNVRALGGNRTAAIANGLSARRIDMWLYLGGGALAALAGVIYTARTGSGQVGAGGPSVTLEVTSAVLIGGTSLFGGLGKVTGSAFGAILFAEIDNALALSDIPALYKNMVVGAILIVAVAADYFRRKRLYKV